MNIIWYSSGVDFEICYRSLGSTTEKFQILMEEYGSQYDINLLIMAIRRNNLEKVKFLVEECKVNINREGSSCYSMEIPQPPLYCAVLCEDLAIVKYLLANGANVNCICEGYSPLYKASAIGCLDIVQILVEYGADIEFTTRHCYTSLMIACNYNSCEVVEYLLLNSAEKNKQTEDGDTALHLCAKKCYLKPIQLLLTYGANLNIVNCAKLTPLMIAGLNGFKDIVEYITSLPICEEKEKAFELLGIAYVLRNQNLMLAREMWKLAAEEQESIETLTDDEMYTRALIVRERILGIGVEDRDYLNCVVRLGFKFAEQSNFNLCLDIFKHAFRFCGAKTYQVLYFFTSSLYLMRGDEILVNRFEILLDGLATAIEEIKTLPISEYTHEALSKIVPTSLGFVYLLLLVMKDDLKLKRLVYRLLKTPAPLTFESSWLHYACKYKIIHFSFGYIPWDFVDSVVLVNFLIEAGADVNAVDYFKYTPLHVAKKLQIVDKLLEYGAHYDAMDCDRGMFRYYSKQKYIKYCNLQCLAARVINDNSISYEGLIPECLYDFVKIH